MDVVTVSGKILSKSKTETVGKDSFKLAKILLSDGKTEVKVDVWENYIGKLEGNTYTLCGVRVRKWNGERKLSTTKECTILPVLACLAPLFLLFALFLCIVLLLLIIPC